jgi:DNA-binding transcriptional regulator GbsR (MarR family)
MRALGLNVSKSPDTFIKEHDTNENLREAIEPKLPDNVKFTSWKKVVENNKNRWKEVEDIVPRNKFLEIIDNQTTDFRDHVDRVQNQYSEMRKLRENLPENEIVLWMDFAENFLCTSVEAVQSSYWNQSMVSLLTMVAYFPQQLDQRLQSYVAVSDVLSHNATVVYTILKKLIPQLKTVYPAMSKIHYLTDSPTSQYRNKTIFKVLTDHNDHFGVGARWNYLESGHGKGPCDGLGASIKRGADMAIRQGKVLIQNAEDFYAWAKLRHSSQEHDISLVMIVHLLVGTTACNLNVPVIGRGFSFSCSILSPLSTSSLL